MSGSIGRPGTSTETRDRANSIGAQNPPCGFLECTGRTRRVTPQTGSSSKHMSNSCMLFLPSPTKKEKRPESALSLSLAAESSSTPRTPTSVQTPIEPWWSEEVEIHTPEKQSAKNSPSKNRYQLETSEELRGKEVLGMTFVQLQKGAFYLNFLPVRNWQEKISRLVFPEVSEEFKKGFSRFQSVKIAFDLCVKEISTKGVRTEQSIVFFSKLAAYIDVVRRGVDEGKAEEGFREESSRMNTFIREHHKLFQEGIQVIKNILAEEDFSSIADRPNNRSVETPEEDPFELEADFKKL